MAVSSAKRPEPELDQTMAEWIHRVRVERGLSLEKFARIVDVSHETVRYWERGLSEPRFSHLRSIFEHLGEVPPGLSGGKLYSAHLAHDQQLPDPVPATTRRKAFRASVLLAAAFVTLQLGASHADTSGTSQKGYVSACPRKDLHGVRTLGIRRAEVAPEYPGQVLPNRCDSGPLAPAESREILALGDDTRHEGVAVLHHSRPADAKQPPTSPGSVRSVHAGSGDGGGKSRPLPSETSGAASPAKGTDGTRSPSPPGGGSRVRPDGKRHDAHIPLRRSSSNRMSDS